MLRRGIWTLVALLGLGVFVYAYLGGASIPVLDPAGPVAAGERSVIFITLLLCSIIVVPVFFLLFYFAWQYKAGSVEAAIEHSPNWDHVNPWAEFFWWLVPTVIIVALSVVMWHSTRELDPYKKLVGSNVPLTVEVVALNWKWLFIYPSLNIATVNMLELPVNSAVTFTLTADAPMNTFWIPQLGGQIMVMPGMSTELNLLASRPGVFKGLSGNVSGKGFAGMNFDVHAVPQEEFDAWVARVKAQQNPLTLQAYTALASTSINNPPAYYSGVEQNLYTSIIMKFMAPQKAPASNHMQM